MTSPLDALLNTSSNMTSYLKRRAEVTWSAIQSRADTVKYADVIVDAMTQRVTSAVASLMTSQSLRTAINMTLNDLVPVDVSVELKNIGMFEKYVQYTLRFLTDQWCTVRISSYRNILPKWGNL